MTLPITLVTGFLGAGKTTCLQHLADAHRGRSLLFVVNEFGKVDVDGARLSRSLDHVVPIPGGSIFCHCLVSTFLEKMQTVAQRASALKLEAVVVEASGMADPRVADRMLSETGLDATFRLAHIVALVDPGSFPKLLHTLPNIRTQVEAADTIVINKTDCYDVALVEEAAQRVVEINPKATLQRTTHGRIALDLLDEKHDPRVTGSYAKCVDPNYITETLRFDRPVSLDALRGMVAAMGNDLLRAKGKLRTSDGAIDFDASASGVIVLPVQMSQDERSQLVLIAHSRARQKLVAATAAMVNTKAAG